MRLDDDDKKMLNGDMGPAKKMGMEMLVAIGKIYGAEKLIPIKSAHVAGLSLRSHGIAGMEWIEDIARKGAQVVVPTTCNVVGIDRTRDLGLPKDWCEYQDRIGKGYEDCGCYYSSSCVPYYHGFIPRFGESIAWAESSAVVFTNAYLGAKDNREGGPSAFAAALCGKTPYYGYHIDENRKGQVLFKVTAPIKDLADIGAMGAYVGTVIGTRNPAFEGVGHDWRPEDHAYLSAALASSGGAAIYHMMGVTPEAVVQGKGILSKDCEVVELGPAELEKGYKKLTSNTDRVVDYVSIGCPHLTLNQIAEVAKELQGKKVKVRTWIHTNVPIKALAIQLGYAKIIEESGAVLTQDLCTVLSIPEELGLKSLATNSAKMAFYAPGSNRLNTWYGSLKNCIDAAVTGRWNA